jgi:two-component system copper resistance phosphate regulon response regulator CusR
MEVSVAADGNMGLEMAQSHNFDIIILDIMLPGMNGYTGL